MIFRMKKWNNHAFINEGKSYSFELKSYSLNG